ncbi:MAG TPA: L,D-transpeptidase family protein [Solirubrobacteraceae bacterium]|jgi:peptidoglycan hydrolase-like protein with peptidoglycan-binding domain
MVKRLPLTFLTAAVLGGGTLVPVAAATEVQPPATLLPAPQATVPLSGKLKLTVQDAHGTPPYAALGERIVIAGGVRPYVAGQRVVVSIYRKGRRVLSKGLGVSPAGAGAGQFHLAYASPHSGLLSIRAEHPATAQLAKLAAKSVSVRYELSTLGVGSRGRIVRLLQEELSRLHYQVNVSGYYDDTTARAVVAFRKVAGQARVESVNARIFQLIQRGAGVFRVRYPSDGAHVEADLSKQVLAEIEKGGRVRRIITISSGKPSTPTVIGRFHVYRKEPGTNSHGMVDSSYFIGGYAIHGYAEVPTYAASHGCLRIPVPDALAVYSWVKFGYAVDVYTDNGHGSHLVRSNVGP